MFFVAQQAEPLWTLRQTPFDLQPASGGVRMAVNASPGLLMTPSSSVRTRAPQAEGLLPTLLQFCSQPLNSAEQELVTCLQPSCADAEPLKDTANEAAKPAMSANLTMSAPLQ